MSCFIMNAEPLAEIANFAETLLNCGYNYFGFSATDSFISACSDCCDNPNAYRPFYNAESIYRKLYSVNVAAYNGRYSHADDTPLDTEAPEIDGEKYTVHQPYEYGNGYYIVRQWHYKLAKLLDCWLYQTCEDATVNDSFRVGVESLRNTLYAFIVRNSAEYEESGWGTL